MKTFNKRAAAVALAFGVAASMISLPTLSAQADPTGSGRGIVGEAPNPGKPMNFAVNLARTADSVTLNKAAALADGLEYTKTLIKWPELQLFYVQSANPDFGKKLAEAFKAAGINFDSIGPTRQLTVSGEELVVDVPTPAAPNNAVLTSRSAHTRLSQLDREYDATSSEDYPVDPDTPKKTWGLYAIHAIEANNVAGVSYKPVTVAILDTGIDGTHPDLKDQILVDKSAGCQVNGIANNSWDAWQDFHYHGTHVAGTVAAALNGVGVEGVAPKAKLMAVRTANDNGSFYPEYTTCAFMWALKYGADVTNNSYYTDPWAGWDPNVPSQAAGLESVTRAVEYTSAKGMTNVAAAGNDRWDLDNLTTDSGSPNDIDEHIQKRDISKALDIPTMLPSVITVSSVAKPWGVDPAEAATATLYRSGFSNYGKKNIDVAAPGSSIYSTFPMDQGEYSSISGTSMASPHVAGVAALIKSVHPEYTPAQVREVLWLSAQKDRLEADSAGRSYEGYGLVDALGAVKFRSLTPADQTVDPVWMGGEDLTLAVDGFEPGEKVTFTVEGVEGKWEAKADKNGKATVIIPNPFKNESGEHKFTATGEYGKETPGTVDLPAPTLKADNNSFKFKSEAEVVLTMTGFKPGEEIELEVWSKVYKVGKTKADDQGKATFKFKLPKDLTFGEHNFVAKGVESKFLVKTKFTVQKPKPPATGVSNGTALPIAALASLAMVGALVRVRKH